MAEESQSKKDGMMHGERRRSHDVEQDFLVLQLVARILRLPLDSVDFDTQLRRTLEYILELPGLPMLGKGAIYLRHDDRYLLAASVGFGPEQPCAEVTSGNCLCGLAIAEKRIIVAGCTSCARTVSTPHAHYCVPTVHRGEVTGLVNVYIGEDTAPRPGSEYSLRLVGEALAGIIWHHQAEQERIRLERQLAKSEKMAALGRLTSRLAHELRNPLTVIGGLARRLQKNHLVQEKSAVYVDSVVRETVRLEEVLNGLLNGAEHGSPEVMADEVAAMACDRDLQILKTAVDNAAEAFVTIDEESTVLFFNRAAEAIFGCTREQAIGRDLSDLIGGGEGERHRAGVARYVRSGAANLRHRTRMTLRRGDGREIPLALSFSENRHGGRIYFTAVLRDLSEEQRIQERLIQSERLAALGQMVAEIGHEIKNPLTTIGGFARQLQRKVEDETSRRKTELIVGEVERLERLLNELRDLYAPRLQKPEPVDLVPLLRDIAHQILEQGERQAVAVRMESDQESHILEVDRERLQQVLLNVAKNGIEAMTGGGELLLSVAAGPAGTIISVRDSGPGMSAEVLRHIFNPFFTTKRHGTGLGLCISKRIVEETMGGLFQVESKEGEGTVFRLVFNPGGKE
ncbi:MAG: ATP-binding protein [Thermodesulfobacteriota bacterium]